MIPNSPAALTRQGRADGPAVANPAQVGTAAAGRLSPADSFIAVDLGAKLGWAAGVAGSAPVWNRMDLTLAASPYDAGLPPRSKDQKIWPSRGRVLARLRAWFMEILPGNSLLVFETPYYGGNPKTHRVLCDYAAVAQEAAEVCGVRCREVTTGEVAEFFTGKGRWPKGEKKAATQKMCSLYGFNTVTFDESDALAVWLYVEAKLFPTIAMRRGIGPLFLSGDSG